MRLRREYFEKVFGNAIQSESSTKIFKFQECGWNLLFGKMDSGGQKRPPLNRVAVIGSSACPAKIC